MRGHVWVSIVCTVVLGIGVSNAEEEYDEEYSFDEFRQVTSLGQLCKTSDLIAIGKLKGKGPKTDGETEYLFQVERVLDGHPKDRTVSAYAHEVALDAFALRNMATNSTYLFFCSHKYNYPYDDKLLGLSFEKERMPEGTVKWFITKGHRGIIQITAENMDAYEQAVKGHLKFIKSKDVQGYFDFLYGLSKSSCTRIRRDAQEDLTSLMRFSASADELLAIEKNPRLTDEAKTLVRQSLDWKQAWKQMEERQRLERLKKKQEPGSSLNAGACLSALMLGIIKRDKGGKAHEGI